ncbi:MAG: ABC transporter permease, partial [Deltaproteobacteria bacterium]
MLDLDRWEEILATLRGNKVRTVLTALGVFWGLFMLTLMLGFGSGLEEGVRQNMRGLAANSFFIWGQRTSKPYAGLQAGRPIDFDNGDLEAVRRLPGIRYFAPRNQLGGWRSGATVVHGTEAGSFSVMGDFPAIQYISPVEMVAGRFLNQLDIDERRKVAVIGRRVYETLFPGGQSAIGERIRIRGIDFSVVGVFDTLQQGGHAERKLSTVFVPFTTFQRVFGIGEKVGWFSVAARDDVDVEALEEAVRDLLKQRHKVAPDDEDAIGSWNAGREFGRIRGLFRGIRLFIWVVGLITLLAGVIGVSNIMLIVVKERTREIGIRKAVGATVASIVGLVVQESVVLTTLAGCLGLLAG